MLTDYLTQQLEPSGIKLEEFQELCLRLLNYGVLCRDESQIEQQLYDRYVRVAEWVHDYLSVVGIQVFHDRRFAYVRLYPPGAQVPGMDESESQAFANGLRARLRQDEVALLLVLRQQYDQALREGLLDDTGYVAVTVESLGIAMRNQLARSLPEKLTDRKRVFERLRKLRLIQYRQEDDLEHGETGLRIHPMIVAFVNEAALNALDESLPEVLDDETQEGVLAQSKVDDMAEPMPSTGDDDVP